MRRGMTLMSVMVAVALAGIVALAVARLLGNQAKSMSVIRLREQRENLLKHYKNIVVSGWDSTRQSSCGGVVCARNGDTIIPTANGGALYLAGDLYEYDYTGGTAGRWWKVYVNRINPPSGQILQADSYVQADQLAAVEVKVEFIRKEHPVVNTRLAPREEIVFLHHNTSGALSNIPRCDKVGGVLHKTQRDVGSRELYSGAGALIQYDFISDYAKCSQVPLVNPKTCPMGALVGFFRSSGTYTLALDRQLITGDPICSNTDHAIPRAEIRGRKEKRTVKAIDCDGQGYIEWIADDEEPHCVAGPAPGANWQRVAGISIPAPSGRQPFTLVKKVAELPCPTPNDLGPPQYADFVCQVPRYEGIEAFDTRGEVAGYVKYYDDFTPIGPRGPQGPGGPCGVCDVPPGPPGLCSCCCNPCPTPTP